MAPRQYKSRIHLLAAKEASTLVILQRKRSKLFHVIALDTEKLRIEEGSWFRGKLYPMRCDVSFDGKYMVYLAMGGNGNTWNGLCRLPWLTTMVDVENMGTWFGGGYFAGHKLLRTNGWGPSEGFKTRTDIPFKLEPYPSRHGGEDLGVVYERFKRDGFTRLGKNWGERKKLGGPEHQIACRGDDGWGCRGPHQGPELKVRYIGFYNGGYQFAFWFDEYPDLLAGVSWATWDASGNLWVARPGVVEQFTPKDLRQGKPSFCLDVDAFEPPPRPTPAP